MFGIPLASCQMFSGHGGPPQIEAPTELKGPAPTPPPPAYTEISLKSQNRRIPVLMYHDVIPERTRTSQWFDCSVVEFTEQMQLLQAQGAVPISIQDLHDHLTSGKEVPETAVVLTFDDNYQGFYDNAWPILKSYGFPATVFVHTGFVGKQDGEHPKMTYETLKELLKDPLFTVGSHTITHPDDLSKLDPFEQEKELRDSKEELERELGVKVDFLAYPNGKNDQTTQELTKSVGYKMAFSIENGLAEESPSLFCVNRYVHTRIDKALEDRAKALAGGALGIFQAPMSAAPITLRIEEIEDVKMVLMSGGTPETVMSETREGVLEFVQRTGAQAGINGTFFAMAAIKSTDNRLVGPCKTHDQPEVVGDEEKLRWEKLRNRPVMMWGPSGVAILPFQAETMRTDAAFRDFMPDVTDVFMGGVWLVHGGVARERDDMNVYGASDIQDARRRAAIGVDASGNMVYAATKGSVSSAKFAKALAAAGVLEAILLDSGFSTSLVYENSVLASGHSTASTPSRPVPHAIVIRGTFDPVSQDLAKANEQKQVAESAPKKRRRRR
jgi:peptidoglycan/xylan/chitin deacetylase (PgdA/CDA1 family)